MSAITRSVRGTILVAAALLLAFSRASSSSGETKAEATATCVLSNPAYSGSCTETVPIAQGSTAAQACQSVLQCLNDVGCLKTYCNATTLRSGWKLESAK